MKPIETRERERSSGQVEAAPLQRSYPLAVPETSTDMDTNLAEKS